MLKNKVNVLFQKVNKNVIIIYDYLGDLDQYDDQGTLGDCYDFDTRNEVDKYKGDIGSWQ